MRAKNPENFVKFRWADFEIFRDLYVEPMAPIGQGEKTLHRSLFNVAGYSFTLCVVGVEPVVLGCHRSQMAYEDRT